MSAHETSDVSDRNPLADSSAERDPRSLSRRALLTGLLALVSGAALVLDPMPAQAGWASFFGIPIPVPGGGRRRSRHAKSRTTTSRRNRSARGKSNQVARPSGGDDASSATRGKLGKADY